MPVTLAHWLVKTAGISGVKSREDLVMSNTDLSATDPFGAAPFKPPAGLCALFSFLLLSGELLAGVAVLKSTIVLTS